MYVMLTTVIIVSMTVSCLCKVTNYIMKTFKHMNIYIFVSGAVYIVDLLLNDFYCYLVI